VVDTHVVFGALVGAITWNLITWWYGIPSSSSHALIGGIVGAVIAKAGAGR
jgi:PiT family inorganic phosphate transporter